MTKGGRRTGSPGGRWNLVQSRLEPMGHTNVPVAKKLGAMRVCGDLKTTINPVLQAEQYPLTMIEDIFANLAAGKRFTKVDLGEAYLQMEIEKDSKMFLTINTLKGPTGWSSEWPRPRQSGSVLWIKCCKAFQVHSVI